MSRYPAQVKKKKRFNKLLKGDLGNIYNDEWKNIFAVLGNN